MTSNLQDSRQFAQDVLEGLSALPKRLSSRYFYDDAGSRLFQQIMRLPEYYLARCELEIFTQLKAEIFDEFNDGSDSFDLIELGAGDGTKTAVLIEHFLARGADLTYQPIDISREACETLTAAFTERFPTLRIDARHGDYFEVLESLISSDSRRKVLLFLGSNIGNFSEPESVAFFRRIRDKLNENDRLFIGFDLQKDPHVILRAYDDSQGVTAEFNINLLRRINRELDADFDLAAFTHYAIYEPVEGAARSFLISRKEQEVTVNALEITFSFAAWEPIFVEISQKYSLQMIDSLAAESGFEVTRNFYDSRRFFTDSLWQPNAR